LRNRLDKALMIQNTWIEKNNRSYLR